MEPYLIFAEKINENMIKITHKNEDLEKINEILKEKNEIIGGKEFKKTDEKSLNPKIKNDNRLNAININENENNMIRLYGFGKLQNLDGVSCYSNAVIQIIFNCPTINKNIEKVEENNTLKKVFNEYINGTLINLYELRSFIHKQYEHIEQQDVAEFVSHLLEKFNFLLNITTIEITTILNQCKCYENEYKIQDQRLEPILKLKLPPNNNVYKLQNLIDYTLQPTLNHLHCDRHCKKEFLDTWLINNSNDILILQLNIFNEIKIENTTMILKTTDFTLNDPLHDIIKINNEKYKVYGVVFHIGESVKYGHYINLLRNESS